MRRPVESNQRKMRLIALRIEGSTGTPTLEGPSKLECTIVDSGTGHYTVTFNKAFTQAPMVVGNCEAIDKAVTCTATTTACVIKVNDIDEDAALSDGDVNLILVGSDASGFYIA